LHYADQDVPISGIRLSDWLHFDFAALIGAEPLKIGHLPRIPVNWLFTTDVPRPIS
jgi:hypothetical protein